MQRSELLTDGPIARTLLRFAFPILGMNVLQCLASSVNAFWVGRYLGEAALTAVANAQSLMVLLMSAAFGLGMAANILVGQSTGAGAISDAKRVAGMGATFAVAFASAMSAAGVVLVEPLLMTMRTSTDSLALAVSYTRVMFLTLPIGYLYTFIISLLLGIGDSKTPLLFTSLSTVTGAALNPVLMFGAGELPGVGIAGSALATLVAQALSLVALIHYLYRCQNPLCLYKYDLAFFRLDWLVACDLLRLGVPIGAHLLVVSFSAVLMIVLVNRFGVDATAAYGASIQIWTYVQLPASAIAVAISSMAAQSIGIENWTRVRQAARVAVAFCTVVTGALILLVYVADSHVYGLFLPTDSPALPIAHHLNRIILWSFVLLMIAVVLFGVMRAAGSVMVPLIIHSSTLLCVRFPLAALLIGRWQAEAIWWSFSISCAVDFVLAALYYRYGEWRGAKGARLSLYTGRLPGRT